MSLSLPRSAAIAYVTAAVVIVLDQITKAWVLHGLDLLQRAQIDVLPFFKLSLVYNRGVSFGLLTGGETSRWLLSLFSVGVAIALAVWVWRPQPLKTVHTGPARFLNELFALAVGLIMGGALGNVIDRVRVGAVIDFLDFSALRFPWVFNVADSAITVGVILLIVDSFFLRRGDPVGVEPGTR
ncbi:signal peptidase II [Brevundimonas sp. 2R-24]|uniref:Lipoprotein signal peptidase n=1 Tax=Peiella sedimenti TaxID=3061083 RepID=A0ABT8SHE8_9CAUL|nr:signal peptidase II [Caulobacteraceae bacterium XZ-24]